MQICKSKKPAFPVAGDKFSTFPDTDCGKFRKGGPCWDRPVSYLAPGPHSDTPLRPGDTQPVYCARSAAVCTRACMAFTMGRARDNEVCSVCPGKARIRRRTAATGSPLLSFNGMTTETVS